LVVGEVVFSSLPCGRKTRPRQLNFSSRHGMTVKLKKKKVALPRRKWQINPATRVKESAKKYSRPRSKTIVRRLLYEK